MKEHYIQNFLYLLKVGALVDKCRVYTCRFDNRDRTKSLCKSIFVYCTQWQAIYS